jgi:phosphopantetheine adenylyltransferase
MPRFIAERPGVMGRMEQDQEAARQGGVPEDEILQYLVDKYHPSWRELRRIRNPMGSFTYVDKNERLLVSDKTTRKEVNIYNRFQRLVQEIGARIEEWPGIDRARKVWVYILLLGEDAKAARVRNERIAQGVQRKDIRLIDAVRNTAKRKKAADALRKSVEIAIRRGRRGAGVR